MPKPRTTFSPIVKPTTSYTKSAADNSALKWTLNSITVTLNSTIAYLNGYFTPTAPNQANNKPATSYAPA